MDLGAPSRGGKKALDATIHVLPFVDLMAMMICFLIVTAIWNQTGRIALAPRGGHGCEGDDQQFVTVELGTDLLVVSIGRHTTPLVVTRDDSGRLDVSALAATLREIRERHPGRLNLTLQSQDAVRYEDVVRSLDLCLGLGFTEVDVSPSMG